MTIQELADTSVWDWPPEAGAEILAVLEDRSAAPSERFLATELAGDLMVLDDALAGELLRILNDETEIEDIRGQAAISFGGALEEADIDGYDNRDDPAVSRDLLERAKEALRGTFQDRQAPKLVRRRALEASVRALAPWHSAAIRAAYRNADPEWKLTAVFCMRFVRGFDREVLDAMDSDDPAILYQAVMAAGDQIVPDAWFRVRALILAAAEGHPLFPEDPDGEWSVLDAAMYAAAVIRPREAPGLLSWFTASQDEDLARAASDALDLAEQMLDGEDDPWGAEPTWH
jgi:hypothetical protein